MTDPATPPLRLSSEQLRVLGALIEKKATVPDSYPMTLKGLQTVCNQKNNREPVTRYDQFEVQRTLDECKALGLVRFVHASHGARSTKYRHVVDEALGLDPAEVALLGVLLLRGPNTVNELRVRTERAHGFDGNDDVEAALEGLATRSDPLVVHLPRQPGQKETRWMHLLGDPDVVDHHASAVAEPEPDGRPDVAPASASAPRIDRVEALEARVARLEATVASLLDEFGMAGSSSEN